MRHRYFLAALSSPLTTRLIEIVDQRRGATEALKAFAADVGATKMYGNTPNTYVFDFAKDSDADPRLWSKTKVRRGQYFYRPRRNTPEGKALAARIKALPSFPAHDDALKTIPGLSVGFPCVIEGSTGYSPFLRFADIKSGVSIVSVPWRDYPEAELDKYREEKAAGIHYSAAYDHALWTPPEWLTEIKEWEALRLIDENAEAA